MTREQRAKRLNDAGYTTIHLFGGFYLIRMYSKSFKKFCPLYLIRYFKKEYIPMPQVSTKVVKPKGKLRIQ